MPKAKAVSLKALSYDAASAEAHLVLGLVLHWYEWEWQEAEREYRRAIELDPRLLDARTGIAELLAQLGRTDEAIAEARAAIDLDPLDLHAQHMLGTVLLNARRADDARAQARKTLDLDPTYVPALWMLAFSYQQEGRFHETLAACQQGLTLTKDDTLLLAISGHALGMLDRREEAEAILEKLLRRRREGYFPSLFLAGCYLGLGRTEEAIEWLRRAIDERDGLCPSINMWHHFDPLRSDPRFQALLQRMNFPQQT